MKLIETLKAIIFYVKEDDYEKSEIAKYYNFFLSHMFSVLNITVRETYTALHNKKIGN